LIIELESRQSVFEIQIEQLNKSSKSKRAVNKISSTYFVIVNE